MLSFTFNLDSYFFYSILPEIFIILFVLSLILIAVTGKKEDKWDLLAFFLEASVYFYVFLIMLLAFLYNSNLFPDNLTVFYCYQTLKLNKILILMKILRVKQIEDNLGKTLISEGIDANYYDMLNYAVFSLIHLSY